MNNILRLTTLALGAATLLLTSCTKEKAVGIKEGELVGYTLQAEVAGTGAGLDIDTKVVLNGDGVTPNWESGDQILVLDAEYKPVGTDGKFTLSSGVGTTSGKFTGSVYVGQKPTYAIYPASAATVSDTEPAATAVTAGTLAAPTGNDAGSIKGAIMLGNSANGTDFTFTNACAVLKFNTGDYGKTNGEAAIKSVKVSASYGETAAPIAGAFTIDWTNLSISKASYGTVNKLTVALPSELQANSKDIYIPIFPLEMQNSTAPTMKYMFSNASYATATVVYNFFAAIPAGALKNLGTAGGLEFILDYVEIPAKYDDTNVTNLKWYRQNIAISTSGDKSWKGGNTSAVKVPGTKNDEVIVGDYFQWSAHEGYCGNADDADKGLLIYTTFNSTGCGDIEDRFTFKSAGGSNTYHFNISTSGTSVGISPYYDFTESSYTKYKAQTSQGILERTPVNDDVASIILGGDWRIPTTGEIRAMFNASYCAWDEVDNGVYIYTPNPASDAGKFNENGSGSYAKSDALLFFPAAKSVTGTSLNTHNLYYYWASTRHSGGSVYSHAIYRSSHEPMNSPRHIGCLVRAVSE